jgi:type IV pilus assembly protein PilM
MSPRNGGVGSWLASAPASVALDITAARVLAVAVADQGGARVITAYASEPLAAGVVTPALNAPNIHDERAVVAAIEAALQQVGRTRRIALVLPDSIAKVSLLRFEKVPPKAQDLEQLIRWQIRKAAPFRIEDAQLTWQPGTALPGGGREYLVTLARRDIIHAYEHACTAAGVHAGVVDITSFNQINAVLATGDVPGDWLLVNVAADYATIAVVRGDDVISFRNRTAGNEGDLADLVHQTAMYHEDRLGGGTFSRVVLAGVSVLGMSEAERLRGQLEERIGMRVDPIDFRPAAELRDRIATAAELVDMLAPAVGMLLRERTPRRAQPRATRPGRVA